MRQDWIKSLLLTAGIFIFCVTAYHLFSGNDVLAGDVRKWRAEWPHTDFAKSSIDFDEISSGGPKKDGIL